MSRIDDLFAEWKSLQPIKESDQRRLDQKFMLEFNFNSNHLEGNTLTYGQTEFLLLFGRAVDGANMKDLEEMKASNVGLQMIKDEAANKEHHLTEYFIRTLHKTLLREDYVVHQDLPDGSERSFTIHAGQYKTRPNSVRTKTGEVFEYASPEETPALMADLLMWYNQAEEEGILSPIELATLFHYRYIRIHPFEDGNGRISRLIVNYILARHGYPMIVVKSSDKDNYLAALNRCDIVTGPIPSVGAKASIEQIQPFVLYLSSCLERSLEVCIKAGKGESIEEPDDFAKQVSLIERKTKKDIGNGERTVTAKDIVDIFNNFHRFAANKLIIALEPARVFFNSFKVYYYLSKDRDTINIGGFLELNIDTPLSMDMTPEKMGIVNDAQSIMFHISMKGVKKNYSLRNISIYLRCSVIFNFQSYSFDGIEYAYGTYPSDLALDNCISKIKNDVLKQINAAVKE
jgi:Fic family protein